MTHRNEGKSNIAESLVCKHFLPKAFGLFFFNLPCAKIENFRSSLDKYLHLYCFAVSLPVVQQDKFKTLYVIAEPIISLSQFYTSRYCGPSSHPKYASIMFIFVGPNQSHETFKSHEIKGNKCVCSSDLPRLLPDVLFFMPNETVYYEVLKFNSYIDDELMIKET